MLAKRSILFVGFVAVVLLLLVVSITQCQQQNGSPYHDFLSSETFQKLSRAQQLDKCATCHQQIFDNEKRGPHAFSFQSITQHKAFVNSKQYDCDFYTQHVNRSFEHCLGCHTPQNLYQTVLNPAQYKSGTMVDSLLHIEHPRPLTRERAGGQLTGIDCMSCHFDGQQMVSLKHIPTKDDSIASKQTVQQLTKNNLNCYLCHFDAVRNFNPDIAIKKPEPQCA